MKRHNLTCLLLILLWSAGWSQTPVITNISTTNLYPKGRITITGSGFSSTPSNLRVIFGHAEAQIIASSDFSIEVEVPPAAKLSTIEVINTASRRMTKSNMKFMPSFYGNGFNTSDFSTSYSFSSPQELRDIISCDLNSDGLPDLLMTKFSAASDIMVMKNTTNPATPDLITFTKELHSVGFSTDHITTGDVDGDGKQDIVMTKGGTTNRNTVFVMLNKSTPTTLSFLSPFSLNLETGHVAIQSSVRDLNSDGRPEIIVTNSWNNTIYVFPNDPSKPVGSNPYSTPVKIAVTGPANTYGLEVQDFDNDGLPDILVNPISTSDHYILRNTSSSSISFAESQKIPLAGELRNVTTADLNKDGKLDIITSSTNTNKVLVLMNASSGPGNFTFSGPITLTADSAPWGISTADIDGDLDADIIVSHQTSSTVDVFINDGSAGTPSFAKNAITTTRPARNLTTGDLNADGKPDIAIATFVVGTYSVDILRNKICHKPVILNEQPLYVCSNPIELKTIPALNSTFLWKEGTNTVKNNTDPFASITSGGSYTVAASTISPAGECTNVASDPVTVTGGTGSVPSDPVLTTNSPICSGSAINFSTTAASGASYKWSGPNGWTTTTTTNTTVISNATAANAGSYTVQIIAGNCKSNLSAPKVVDVVAVDEFKITSNSLTNSACSPGSVKLTVNNVSGFTYSWKKDNGTYSSETTVNTYDASATGAYYAKVNNSTLGCSKEIGPVKVAILTPPVANFTIGDSRCANAPVQFTSTSTLDPMASGESAIAPAQYAWQFGDSKTSTQQNPTNTYTLGGISYNVTLTVSYQGVSGCSHSKVLAVAIANSTLPVLTASPEQICPDQNATITVTPEFQQVVWEHGATGASVMVNQPGTYTANCKDANGCVIPKSIVISSKEVPVIEVSADKTAIPPGQSVQLSATGAHVFVWSPAESLNDPNIPNPVATPTSNTTYTVVGNFVGGCSAQGQIQILIDGSIISISPPVAFSPNGDGPNDLWVIDGVERYSDCTLSIFDARGARIYQKTGYTNDWDGTYQGRPVPGGTYYYVFSCPSAKPLTGSVLVFR